MKTLKTFLALAFFAFTYGVTAQTADEIINNYIQNTGGADAWGKVEALKIEGSVKIPSQGLDLPITAINLKSGKQISYAVFQGLTFVQQAYDGESAWGTNQMTMKPEKQDNEATENLKRTFAEFPDPFLNYKEKGFSVELMGTETVDGTETFKVKLIKTPVLVDGKEEENVSYYYFDKENFVPIMIENTAKAGPMKGTTTMSYLSDYQEMNGLVFPLTTDVKFNGQSFQTVTLQKIEINPTVEDSAFSMPTGN